MYSDQKSTLLRIKNIKNLRIHKRIYIYGLDCGFTKLLGSDRDYKSDEVIKVQTRQTLSVVAVLQAVKSREDCNGPLFHIFRL